MDGRDRNVRPSGDSAGNGTSGPRLAARFCIRYRFVLTSPLAWRRCAARRRSRPRSQGGDDMTRIVVVGDLMTDTVARATLPLAKGSDTPATVTAHGGGSGANIAAWLAS